MLAGLEEITEGNVFIGDRRVNTVAAKDRDIAMVFQSYALYPHMTVRNNMAFSLSLLKVPKDEIRERVAEAAELLGITPFLDRKPGQLSGGQRQRVALGRAIVRQPAVFLLDEPLSNLEAKLRVQTRAEISKLHRRLETTFIYVTHDQTEAMTMATKIAVMNEGRLQQVGTPQEVYERPNNVFVAGFIGSPSINLFEGQVVADRELLQLDAGTFQLPVGSEHADALRDYIGRTVIFGIRPENIHDPAFQPTGIESSLVSATVEVAEMMGNETILHTRLGEHLCVARVDPRTADVPGAEITLAFDTQHVLAFDPLTELAIRGSGVNND